MPSPALLLLVATLLPLVSFGVLMFLGWRMGSPAAGWLATFMIFVAFGCTLAAMISWYRGAEMVVAGPAGLVPVRWGYGQGPIEIPVKWIPSGVGNSSDASAPSVVDPRHSGWLDLEIYVDSLTIAMFAMITLVSSLVHLFSITYMRSDPRYARYFAYLGFFCFSMLSLVIGGTLLHLFIFWELVGISSYLLIGFWFEKRTAANAAIKAFIINRIGDAGLMVGLGILFCRVGNVTLPHLWLALGAGGSGGAVTLADGSVFTGSLLTLTGIAMFCGAIGKSAQFPLHVWLPDAMEGPTPVSALIHAATMVAAGVYLLGRIFPILSPGAKLFIAIIGLVTLSIGALIAAVQSDIKRVLAFSTISQLGYMIMAMGLGSWVGGLFHLLTHAFFKALLFLATGSVILAAGHEQELSEYGGLLRKIPWTAAVFGIGVLAIAGTPLFSGYYSKEMILRDAAAFASFATGAGGSGWYWAFLIVPTAVAYLTAFYMARCWMLTFWGRPRNVRLFARARETPALLIPLAALAVLTVLAGSWLSIPDLLQGSLRESQATHQRLTEADASGMYRNQPFGLSTAWPVPVPPEGDRASADSSEGSDKTEPDTPAVPIATELTESERCQLRGEDLARRYASPAFAIGIALGFVVYLRGYAAANRLVQIRPLRWVHRWLYRRMYFDELYFSVMVAGSMGVSRIIGWFDRTIVDGAIGVVARCVAALAAATAAGDDYLVDGAVDGVGRMTQAIGAAARSPQTGRIRLYVTLLVLFSAISAAAVVVVLVIH